MAYGRTKRKMSSGEARQFFDRMYEKGDRERASAAEAKMKTPEGEADRQARNAAMRMAFAHKPVSAEG